MAGIIGASRNNGLGIQGIADQVVLMPLRVVPDGDEYDKDVALAIRYAVDMGAAIINMSFGKDFSPEKPWVDSAIQYAKSKNVLLVHAAGNDAANLDSALNYPNAHLGEQPGRAPNFVTVGASSDPKIDGNLVAHFSNFGRHEVDLFAPGMKIYSTLPHGNQYGKENGTSMAAPVVTGIAALLKSYFPNLSAIEIKEILEQSAYRPSPDLPCALPGAKNQACQFNQLSISGGIVNAYAAVQLAGQKQMGSPAKKQ
ncbi:MAG: hypothetical protein EAZ62_04515 [Sphingobacteriia bacterium]|nr:MAG: hypothetical protein EAZ62_04515 [Sphingobacteriia bacterium]